MTLFNPHAYTYPAFDDKITELAEGLGLKPILETSMGVHSKMKFYSINFPTQLDMLAFSDLVEELYNL